jgi:hypothetical protein
MRLSRASAAVMMVVGLWMGPMQLAAAGGLCGGPGEPPDNPVEALAPAMPPGSLEVQDTRIHWTGWPTSVIYGDLATLQGQVVTDDGALADAEVDLQARPVGSQRWQHVNTTTTDADTGVFTFGCLQPTMTTDYRAVYAGTVYYAGSQANRHVPVARRVPDSIVRVAPDRFRYSGSVRPRYAGGAVTLQQRRCPDCRWRTSSRTTSDGRSGWRFVIDASTFRGRRWFRAVVPANAGFIASPSEHAWRLIAR